MQKDELLCEEMIDDAANDPREKAKVWGEKASETEANVANMLATLVERIEDNRWRQGLLMKV